MVRRDGAEIRRERIQKITRWILGLLHEEGEICLSKTLAKLEYEIGPRSATLMEYLKIGETTGHFIVDEENNKIRKITENEVNNQESQNR